MLYAESDGEREREEKIDSKDVKSHQNRENREKNNLIDEQKTYI